MWKWKLLSHVRLFATAWTLQSMEFSRPEHWSSGHSLLQRIFPTQGLNPGLLHCRWILYQLSHKGSPRRVMSWLLNIGQNFCFWALWNYSTGKVSTKIKIKSLSHPHLGSRLWRRKTSRATGREGGKGDSERLQIVPGVRAQRPLESSTSQKDSGSIKNLVKYAYSNQQLDLARPGGMWKWPDSIGRKRKIVKQLQNLQNRRGAKSPVIGIVTRSSLVVQFIIIFCFLLLLFNFQHLLLFKSINIHF